MKVKQNIISFLLGMLIMLPVGSYATTQIIANVVNVPIVVDGEVVDTTVYNISNKNYTSARDIAEAMGGTVEWKDNKICIFTIQPGTIQDVAKQADNCVYISMMKDSEQKATASGVLWGTDYILTNRHVVEQYGVNKWAVADNKMNFGRYYCTEAKTFDTLADIALIKTEVPHGGNVKVGDSSKLKVGDEVVVISSPRGVKNVVSSGRITKIQTLGECTTLVLSNPTSPGSSGGGVFNMQGELVGLIYGGYENENIATAITINCIKDFLQ